MIVPSKVVNPFVDVYAVSPLPARSFTPVETLILYVVEYERLSDGSSVNVLSELELEGDEDICIQELKLLEDNANEPEQDVFDVLVVIEVLSIASEKVTEMLLLIETPPWLSIGEVDETVGGVVSVEDSISS